MPVEDWKIWRRFARKETTFLHSPHKFLWVKFRADEYRRSGSGAWFNLSFIEHAFVEAGKIFVFSLNESQQKRKEMRSLMGRQ